jgi:transposase InsO family protein
MLIDHDQARASKRTGPGTGKVGYTYLHTAIDDHSRLAYTEALDDERAVTAAAFWHRAVAFFAAHDITPFRRVPTDNGSCYRSHAWRDALAVTGTKHKRTRPYTPRTNGKVERFNGTLVGLGQVRMGVGMSRWQVGQAPVQRARSVCRSRTTW